MSFKFAYPDAISAIAISGPSGCGNTSVNTIVAERLGLSGINYTMRNYAAEKNIPMEELAQQAEHSLDIDHHVDQFQIELALKGPCVLSSRLAIWLLPKASLKVYLYAPLEVRAKRIWQREGGELGQQIQKTRQRDAQNSQRYLKLYELNDQDFFFSDLIINTESFDQYAAANMIISAYEELQKKAQS